MLQILEGYINKSKFFKDTSLKIIQGQNSLTVVRNLKLMYHILYFLAKSAVHTLLALLPVQMKQLHHHFPLMFKRLK